MLAGMVACERWPAPPFMSSADHEADVAKWREARRNGLVRPGSGAVTWIGLWDLPNGSFSVGSADSSDILLLDDKVPPASHSPRRVVHDQ